MERLTIPDEKIDGGLRRAVIDAKVVKEFAMTLYWALKAYEDTGLTPEQVRELQERQRWIPVSERMPVEPEENPIFENKKLELYLVSVRNTDYAFRAFWNGKSFTDGWSKLDVIAWMPLPEPYKQEEGYA